MSFRRCAVTLRAGELTFTKSLSVCSWQLRYLFASRLRPEASRPVALRSRLITSRDLALYQKSLLFEFLPWTLCSQTDGLTLKIVPEGFENHREYFHSLLISQRFRLLTHSVLRYIKQVLCQYWKIAAISLINAIKSVAYHSANRPLEMRDMSSDCLHLCTLIMTKAHKPLIRHACGAVAESRRIRQ